MLKAERIEIIKELSRENEIISWEKLQTHLNASKATVRRDIDELIRTGMVKKTRGGVIFCNDRNNTEPSNELRLHINPTAKGKIAATAVKLVHDRDFLMMDSGSTVLELVRHLPKSIQLGIVTYALPVALELDDNENADVYLIGGQLRKHFVACHGYLAEQMMSQFHAKICFLGADAVSVEDGISGYNTMDVSLKRIMIERSEKVILLVDHSKFTSKAFMDIAPIDAIDMIITDDETDEKYIESLREKNIEVIVAH